MKTYLYGLHLSLLAGCIFLIFGCSNKVLLRESIYKQEYTPLIKATDALGVVFIDTLQIKYDQKRAFPEQRYRYYLKRQLPVDIESVTVFETVEFQHSIINLTGIAWQEVNLPLNAVKIRIPVNGSVVELPGQDYPFVLILLNVDVLTKKELIKDITDSFLELTGKNAVQHHLKYVIWDNRDRVPAAFGLTSVTSVPMEYYIGTQKWEELTLGLAEQVFQQTPFSEFTQE